MRYSNSKEYKHLYGYRWNQRRVLFLNKNPLCAFCQAAGRVAAATVVDHITPHKGDPKLFWSESNWQGLCKDCHDAAKKREESHGFSGVIGLDGWPTDPNHPVNARETSNKPMKSKG